MRVYILKRLLEIVPTILMITLVVFVMMRSIPGDPVVALLGDAYTEEDAIKVRAGLRARQAGRWCSTSSGSASSSRATGAPRS